MMFLAPDGRVFNAGPNKLTGYIDVVNGGTWTDGPEHQLGAAVPPVGDANRYFHGAHHEGTAVMYEPGKILVIGGSGAGGVTNTVERINLNDATPQFQYDASMAYPRAHVNSTVLPDGSVLVTGGIPNGDKRDIDAILPAEMWTPPASGSGPGSWTTLNPMGEPRLYHSTAVLLPDGRVLSAGGGHGGGYTDHPTAEVFSPPYLFKGPRPEISYAPATTSYGQPFAFNSPTPGQIDAVTWIRLSSVTHSFNMNQRFLRLPITARTGTSVTVTAPASPNDCPPGHYMVFALRNGVPSEARIVSISNNPCAASISLTTSISQYSCGATATADVSGSNLGGSYRWYLNGVHQPAFDGQPSAVAQLTNCASQAAFAVEVIPACGGAPLTASQTVSAGPFGQGGTLCACE
ncbi:galactose oxidase early set domain-containing protein [Hymenobacter gummosus]|nr:galactose oxidase early set domain-containing protein [Hymenobacter gummosus]